MEKKKFEIEGDIEPEIEITEEEPDDNEEGNGGSKFIIVLLALFIFLFLMSASAFIYFQFYQGNGKWEFSLIRHNSVLAELKRVTAENKKLITQIDSLTQLQYEKNFPDTAASYQSVFSKDTSGDKFEVQIGYFKTFDFSVYSPNLVNMNVESSNGSTKLLIGHFNTFEEACNFRRDIVAMGIKGAFVVKKTNGVRVPFEGTCP